MPIYTFGTSGDVTLIQYSVIAIIKGVGKANLCVKEVTDKEYQIYRLCVLHMD